MKKNLFLFLAVVVMSLFLFQPTTFAVKEGPNPDLGGPNSGNPMAPTGKSDVSLYTGAFSYSYPLSIPQGKMQPQLALSYNSQGNNGIMGVGWSIGPLISIYRSTAKGVPTYDDSKDSFVANMGSFVSNLIKISTGPYTDKYTKKYYEYRTEIGDDYTKFRYYYDISESTPSWRAWDKTGACYEFVGLIRLTTKDNTISYNYWGIKKITDTNDNYAQYTYTAEPTEYNVLLYHGEQISTGAPCGFVPIKIAYGGNSSTGLLPKHEIIISTESGRSDNISNFKSGFAEWINAVISTITIKSNGQLAKKYTFGYSMSFSSLTILRTINEYGNDGASNLYSTSFDYQSSTWCSFNISSWSSNNFSPDILKKTFSTGDFNGDGLSDTCFFDADTGYTWVGVNMGNGNIVYSTWSTNNFGPSPYDTWRVGDFNGDGKSDICFYGPTDSTVWVGISDGSKINYSVWHYSTWGSGPVAGWRIGDFNGDGTSDICFYSDYDGKTWVGISNGTSFDCNVWNNKDQGNIVSNFRIGDFNGDGFDDMCYLTANSAGAKVWVGINCSTANVITWQQWGYTSQNSCTNFNVADFNGDGLSDMSFIYQNSSYNTIVGITRNYDITFSNWTSWFGGSPFFLGGLGDYFANGLTGVCDYKLISGLSSELDMCINNGNTFCYMFPHYDNYGDPSTTLRAADFNGDGQSDICFFDINTGKTIVGINNCPSNLLIKVKSNLGGTTNIDYGSYNRKDTYLLPFPVKTVNSISSYDGMSSTVTSRYFYYNGLYDRSPYDKSRREFLGFQTVRTSDTAGNYTETCFGQNFYQINNINVYKGKIYDQVAYDINGNQLTRTMNTYSCHQPFSGVYCPRVTQTDNYFFSKHTQAQYVYDNYGNVTNTYNFGDYDTWGDEKAEAVTYNYNDDSYNCKYLVSYPSYKETQDKDYNKVSASYIYYDANPPVKGQVYRVENWCNIGSTNPTVSMTYDSYGNVITQTDARENYSAGTGSKITKYYDSTYYNFVTSTVYHAIASTQCNTYDYRGLITTAKDINGLSTQYQYDVFGRPITEIGPKDNSTYPTATYEYTINPAGPPHTKVKKQRINHKVSGTLDAYTYLDGMGRTCEQKSPAPQSGKQIISGIQKYDVRGLVVNKYVPYTINTSTLYSAPDYTKRCSTTTYDALGRVTQVKNTDGTTVSKSYNDTTNPWEETVTNENNVQKDYYKDADGNITQVTEHNNTGNYDTTYTYDTLNNLKTITNSMGHVTTINYDSLGRKTGMTDPQVGTYAYAYDLNGNLTSQTDNKNQTITMTYDRFNRISTKVYPSTPSTSVTYTYDSGPYAKGKLTSVSDLAGAKYFTYDELGRVIISSRSITGISGYKVVVSSYDALGREVRLTYPDDYFVVNNYQGSGLNAVSTILEGRKTSTIMNFASLTYDETAVGKLASMTQGNSVITNYYYNTNNYRLSAMNANRSGNIISSFTYAYDSVGNITDITDGTTTINQSFFYDYLNRLTVAVSENSYGTKYYEYDRLGNITYNPDVTDAVKSYSFEGDTIENGTNNGAQPCNGRMGNGLSFDGNDNVTINSYENATDGISVELWALNTGGGKLVEKQNSYGIECNSTGTVKAWINFGPITRILYSENNELNIWKHIAMTYDLNYVRLYVNGVVKSTSAYTSWTMVGTTNPVVMGNTFTGRLDEVNIYSRGISPTEVSNRFNAMPDYMPNQPNTPSGLSALIRGTSYQYTFYSFDLDGNNIKYFVDWGDSSSYQSGLLANGTILYSTHAYTTTGTYSIRVQATDSNNGVSCWSDNLNVDVRDPDGYTGKYVEPRLIGAGGSEEGNGSTKKIFDTFGENIVGNSTNTATRKCFWGYKGTIVANQSLGWDVIQTKYNITGLESTAPIKMPVSLVETLTDTTSITAAITQYQNQILKDKNGNMVICNGRWIQFDYDNRPIKVVMGDGSITQFAYDYEGQRVKKLIAGTTAGIYIGTIYEEATGGEKIKYIYAGSQMIASTSTGSTGLIYFQKDHLGSTYRITDKDGNIVRTNKYCPYGSMFATTGSKDTTHKFTGQILDDNTNLYYYNARYYDPQLCMFITADSIVKDYYDPQTLNRYSYCRNNPIRYIDPTGNEWWNNLSDLSAAFNQNAYAIATVALIVGTGGLALAAESAYAAWGWGIVCAGEVVGAVTVGTRGFQEGLNLNTPEAFGGALAGGAIAGGTYVIGSWIGSTPFGKADMFGLGEEVTAGLVNAGIALGGMAYAGGEKGRMGGDRGDVLNSAIFGGLVAAATSLTMSTIQPKDTKGDVWESWNRTKTVRAVQRATLKIGLANTGTQAINRYVGERGAINPEQSFFDFVETVVGSAFLYSIGTGNWDIWEPNW